MPQCLDQSVARKATTKAAGIAKKTESEWRRPSRYLKTDPFDDEEIEGWAILRGWGMSPKEVAQESGIDVSRVEKGLADFDKGKIPRTGGQSKGKAPRTGGLSSPASSALRVEILFPVGPLISKDKGGACPHKGPIPRGAAIYCAVCDQCGLDDVHPLLIRIPSKDPRPESEVSDRERKREELLRRRKPYGRILCETPAAFKYHPAFLVRAVEGDEDESVVADPDAADAAGPEHRYQAAS